MAPSKVVCDLEVNSLCDAESQARLYVEGEEGRQWASILRQVTVVERRIVAARVLQSTPMIWSTGRHPSPKRVRVASAGKHGDASPTVSSPPTRATRAELLLEKYRRLLEAIKMDNTQEVIRMLDRGVPLCGPPELKMRPVLHEACLHASRQTVLAVLDSGADANQMETFSGRAALHYAAGRSDPAIVDVLLERRADVTARDAAGCAPLDKALADRGVLPVVKALWRAEREAGVQRLPQLVHGAARAGHLTALQLFWEGERTLPALRWGPADATPLHTASGAGQTAVVWWLLECGADVQVRDAEGNTPLHSAVGCRRCEGAVTALLKAKVDVEHVNAHGHTAFAAAAAGANEVALRLLTPAMELRAKHLRPQPMSDVARAHDLLRAKWRSPSSPLHGTPAPPTTSHLPVVSQPAPLPVARPSHLLDVCPLPRATSVSVARHLVVCDDVGSVPQMKTALRYAEVAAGRASLDDDHTSTGAKRWSPLDARERRQARRGLGAPALGSASVDSVGSPGADFPKSPVLQSLAAPWRLLELQ